MFKRIKTESLGPPDWVLAGAVLGLVGLGVMMVYSSSSEIGYRLYDDAGYFFKRQLVFALAGLAAMTVVARMHYKHWTKLSIPVMVVTLILLTILAVDDRGRQLFGDSVSPVELAKLATVIYIGHWLSTRGDQLTKAAYGLLPFTIMVGILAGLVMAQSDPDLSEALIIIAVAGLMFFLAGADLKQYTIGLAGGAASFYLVASQLRHADERLESFLGVLRDPMGSDIDQLKQGIRALGSGGILGRGIGLGRIKFSWLPVAHTDSIFAVIGEELGLLGCLLVIGLLALIVTRGLRIAFLAPDAFSRMLAVGVSCWIGFQSLLNLTVVTGLVPFTGSALPFVSLGGSSLTALLVGVGLMLSISRTLDISEEAAVEAGSIRRRDRRSRLSRSDRHTSPA
jgi:cell division protein FtsW